MQFDTTINLGNILTAVAFLASFYVAHTQNIRRLENIETRLHIMYEWFQRNVINKEK